MEHSRNNDIKTVLLNLPQRGRRRYILGFLFVMLAFDLVEFFFCMQAMFPSTKSRMFSPPMQISPAAFILDRNLLIGLIIGQTILLSIWAGLGSLFLTLRFFATLVFIEFWCLLLPALSRNSNPYTWNNQMYYIASKKELFNTLLATFLTIAILLSIGRLAGLRITNLKTDCDRDSSPYRFQFTIRCLLEWLTLTAVFMGTLTYVFGRGESFVLHRQWKDFAFEAAISTVLAFVSLWLALGIGWTTIRMVVQSIIAFAILRYCCVGLTTFADTTSIIATALLMSSLWFFRGLGYRLIWRTPSNLDTPSGEATT